jgi:hypothetical protein
MSEIHDISEKNKNLLSTALNDLFGVISNEKSRVLFKGIASASLGFYGTKANVSSIDLERSKSIENKISKTDSPEFISKKEYNCIIVALIKVRLVKRMNRRKYFATEFGREFYKALSLIEDAFKIQDRLHLVDLLAGERGIKSNEQNNKIIEMLIEDKRLQEILKKDSVKHSISLSLLGLVSTLFLMDLISIGSSSMYAIFS